MYSRCWGLAAEWPVQSGDPDAVYLGTPPLRADVSAVVEMARESLGQIQTIQVVELLICRQKAADKLLRGGTDKQHLPAGSIAGADAVRGKNRASLR